MFEFDLAILNLYLREKTALDMNDIHQDLSDLKEAARIDPNSSEVARKIAKLIIKSVRVKLEQGNQRVWSKKVSAGELFLCVATAWV